MYTQYYSTDKEWKGSEEKKARDMLLNALNVQGAKDASNTSILPVEALKLINEVFGNVNLDHLGLENKDVVLAIGITGSGKSTSISRLMGAPIEEFSDDVGATRLRIALNAEHPERYPVIGQEVEPQTLTPEVFPLANETILAVDCAGFSDTRGIIKALIALVGIDLVITRAKSIKGVINIIAYDQGDARLTFFRKNGIEKIKKTFPRLDAESMKSMLFLLTKVHSNFRKPGFVNQISKVKVSEKQKAADTRLPELGDGGRIEAAENAAVLELIESNADRLWVFNILDKPLLPENGFKKTSELLEMMGKFNGLNKDSIKLDRAIPEIEALRIVLFAIADEFIRWAKKTVTLKQEMADLKKELTQVQDSLKNYRQQKKDLEEGKDVGGKAIAAKEQEINNKKDEKTKKQTRLNDIVQKEIPIVLGTINACSATHNALVYENSTRGGGFFWAGHSAWFEYHAPPGRTISHIDLNRREGKLAHSEGGVNHPYFKVRVESTGGFLDLDQKADADVKVYLRYCDLPSVVADKERANSRKLELEKEQKENNDAITTLESEIADLDKEITNLKIDQALLQKTIANSITKLEAREKEIPGIIQNKKDECRKYQFWIYHSQAEIAYLGSLFKDVKVLEPSQTLGKEYAEYYSQEARANFDKLYGPNTPGSPQPTLFQPKPADKGKDESLTNNNASVPTSTHP